MVRNYRVFSFMIQMQWACLSFGCFWSVLLKDVVMKAFRDLQSIRDMLQATINNNNDRLLVSKCLKACLIHSTFLHPIEFCLFWESWLPGKGISENNKGISFLAWLRTGKYFWLAIHQPTLKSLFVKEVREKVCVKKTN